MNKSDLLKKAFHYFYLSNQEYSKNGDNNKRREYIQSMIDYMKRYENSGGKQLIFDIYKPLRELKKQYYEELIFTPTVEDLEEMQYWI